MEPDRPLEHVRVSPHIARRDAGRLGSDELGQLGTGIEKTDSTVKASDIPLDVKGLTSGVASLATGLDSACAVLTTGAVKCWGHDEYGKLGNASKHSLGDGTPGHQPPVDVVGLTDVKQVSVGRFHACAVTNAGKLFCWGDTSSGALGLAEDATILEAGRVPNEVTSVGSDVTFVTAPWKGYGNDVTGNFAR